MLHWEALRGDSGVSVWGATTSHKGCGGRGAASRICAVFLRLILSSDHVTAESCKRVVQVAFRWL